MTKFIRLAFASTLLLGSLVAGCTLLTEVDRTAIKTGTDAGGTAGSMGTAGSGGTNLGGGGSSSTGGTSLGGAMGGGGAGGAN